LSGDGEKSRALHTAVKNNPNSHWAEVEKDHANSIVEMATILVEKGHG
jgi:hypothetical protein